MLSQTLLARYLVGFSDANHTAQAPNLPNHVAWSLGHLAITMHRIAEKIDGRPLPASDFVEGSKAGDGKRFGTEAVSFGSTPVADLGCYPGFARCVEVFGAACARVAAAARGCEDGRLDTMSPWGGGQASLYALAQRMVFHNGVHCGQIADLRRALGMGSIFG